jgi:Ala-tRNA(Pro) deacylase
VSEHPAVYTIEDMDGLELSKRGEVCKNLFLRDAKGRRYFLLVLRKEKQANLKQLAAQLATAHLSFASEERLMSVLKLDE